MKREAGLISASHSIDGVGKMNSRADEDLHGCHHDTPNIIRVLVSLNKKECRAVGLIIFFKESSIVYNLERTIGL